MTFETQSFVDHAAYFVDDPDFDAAFFAKVLGMPIREVRGEKPAQQIFINGGIQLIQKAENAGATPVNGHLGIMCADREDVLRKAREMGIEVLPQGKGNWLRLPDGLVMEILQAKEGSCERYGKVEQR